MSVKQLIDCSTGQAQTVPLTAAELAQQQTDVAQGTADAQTQATFDGNRRTLVSAAQTALVNNVAYLGVPAPTNAQVVAQVAALTRQVDALIRLAVADFTATT